MSRNSGLTINNKWILSVRGAKNQVDWNKPYAWLVEKERTSSGLIEDTATIFLTNRECPYKCLMCDLWKNTSDKTIPLGSIPQQIEWALSQMPLARHLKLYNSGSFFDEKAIPEKDYPEIARLVENFETVIVESHAKLINDKCIRFRNLLKPDLHIAIGLETVNPFVLKKLNKGMKLADFSNAVKFLTENNITSRAFILLRPPFMTEKEGEYWAKRSIDFAFNAGVECCIVIPVRPGNGAMDILLANGDFNPPEIKTLEDVLEYGINLKSGRVFADLWDLRQFSKCDKCFDQRTSRLQWMNFNQVTAQPVECSCN